MVKLFFKRLNLIILSGVKLSEPGYRFTGLFAMVGHPLFYWIWDYYGYVESISYRIFCTVISAGLFFSKQWSVRYHTLLLYYWYVFLIFCIKGFFTYFLLLNHFNFVWFVSFTCSIYILGLLIDWKNFIIITVLGDGFAIGLYLYLYGPVEIPANYLEMLFLYGFINSSCLGLNFRSIVLKLQKLRSQRFISAKISHEIGTPVAAISIISDGLIDLLSSSKPLQQSHKEMLTKHLMKISKQTEQIKALLSIMLSNAKRGYIDAHTFTHISVRECIDEAIERFSLIKSNLSQMIHVDIQDAYQLNTNRQLFVNLLLNLIKNGYAALYKKGEGELTITTYSNTHSHFLEVKDTGTGIPSEIQADIFADLTGSIADEDHAGLGLGFVKTLVDAMGGSIDIESEYGSFTVIRMKFPRY